MPLAKQTKVHQYSNKPKFDGGSKIMPKFGPEN